MFSYRITVKFNDLDQNHYTIWTQSIIRFGFLLLYDLDIFYYNVLPFDWDTHIIGAEFTVNFHFDTSQQELYDKTMVYIGEQGTTSPLNASINIPGSVASIPAMISKLRPLPIPF